MSDILDYIRAKLIERPLTPEAVESALSEARQTYGGDRVYVPRPKVRKMNGNSRNIANENGVSVRTAQRWRKRENI
jgi:hypothetical protein